MKPWKNSIVYFRWWKETGSWKVITKDGSWCQLEPLDNRAKEISTNYIWIQTRDLIR